MKPRPKIKPTDRKISAQTIALGAIVFLVLASGFFFAGLWGLGPVIGRYLSPRPRIEQTVRPPAETSSREQPTLQATDSAGNEKLDIQITEEGEDQQVTSDDQTASSDSGVKQDGNTLTVTLEPKTEREKNPPSAAAEKEKPPSSHTNTSSEAPRDTGKRPDNAPSSPGSYRVQAGTFANKSNAESLAQDLKARGYKAEIKSVQREAGTLYRVELGTFKSREGAQNLADDLTRKGYAPTITSERKLE